MKNGGASITSIDVETFFSLILSYFCFFVPAFSPCQGRLHILKSVSRSTMKEELKTNRKRELHKQKKRITGIDSTFLLRSTLGHNPVIPNHPFGFVL